ncbi:MAG TPA: YHYH protein [Verrucomicrobiae bacterium]|nr:YHYH protein [Verrucomicrobiae bacterium]
MKIRIQPVPTKKSAIILLTSATVFLSPTLPVGAGDPRTNCWLTMYSARYARVYTNSTMQMNGTALTTWRNGSLAQSLPAYCGVQEVYSSSNWIYVRSTGLASYTMGPWYLNSAHTQLFPNLPTDQQVLYRFPRTNCVPATRTENGGGQIGIFVDGVEMFNSWDAYTWDPTNQMNERNITGYWNRDAYVNEGVTFDPGNAHQQGTGVYHYHADPLGLRYLLGDHVDYNPNTKTFSEDTNAPVKHSPILAWTADGIPLYGPYGYSNATNANSGIRRMVSGYILRNGQDGTSNLTLTGRTTIPQWAVRLYNVTSNQPGPNVSLNYPLDDYMEDNDYLGDLINTNTCTNFQQGVDFDLDQFNGRWCVTPEFPNGIYAYFVSVNSNGAPAFPYDIGRGFYGSPIGGAVSAISETVTTNFLGYTNLASTLNSPAVKSGTVTLTWSALEGGSYEIQTTTNLTAPSWTTLASSVSPNEATASYTNVTAANLIFYRIGRTSVAPYQGAGTTVFSTTSLAPGGSASPGQTVTITITLPSSPPWPPASAPITSVTLTNTVSKTSITTTNESDSTQGTVLATFTIPSTAPPGSQNVIIVFQPAPTYTLMGGFTIN